MVEASWIPTDISPALGIGTYRVWMVKVASTNSGYLVTMTPATYGTIVNINGCDSDTGAVEDPTWAPSTGVITIGGSSNNGKARTYVVYTLR